MHDEDGSSMHAEDDVSMPDTDQDCISTTDGSCDARRASHAMDVNRAEITTRKATSDTALEVDLMILDHCAYQAISGVLNVSGYRSEEFIVPQNIASLLSRFQSWLEHFHGQWCTVRIDLHTTFRLALLQFATLYHRRQVPGFHTPDLDELDDLRNENERRAMQWIDSEERVPTCADFEHLAELFLTEEEVPDAALTANRERVLEAMGERSQSDDDEPTFYGSDLSLSLLDMLPLFMRLCAAALAIHDCAPTADGLNLCLNFIRQACLEQYLIYGRQDLDAIDQAFSWGCYASQPHDQDSKEWQDDRMFRSGDDNGLEMHGWHAMKSSALHELLTSTIGETKQQRLERLAKDYPVLDFHNAIISFLADLATVIPVALLAQVERGWLEGKTAEQTTELLKAWDVDVDRLLR